MDYRSMDQERSFCLEWGEPIVYGRTDKKFCCESCKNRFNNRKIRNSRNMKQRIWNALEKNHSILESLIKLGIVSIRLPDLCSLGFNPEYSTSYHKVGNHKEFRCFDIVYYLSESRIFGIRRVAAFVSELVKVADDS